MMTNEKLRPYIFAFLLFCVCSSKHIIIYNEETLVALSFFSFIFFVYYYYAPIIAESFDERSSTIKSEVQNFLTVREESLHEILKEHQKILQIHTILHALHAFTMNELSTAKKFTQKAFSGEFSHQIIQKLKSLSSSKSTIQQKLQKYSAENIYTAVMMKFKKQKNRKNKGALKRLIQNAINLYKSTQPITHKSA